MNVITKLATKLLATFSVVAMLSNPAAAQGLKASEMTLAFSQAPQTARSMSAAEMDETEGAALPALVVRAVVMGGIGAVVNAANARNNGATTRQIIRSAAIGFAGGAIGGVVSKKLR